MAPKKESSSSTSTHQPAIGTRTSERIARPNLGSDTDPQQPPVNVAPSSSGSGKAKLGCNVKPPRFKKAETKNSDGGGGGGESLSMGLMKKVNSGPAAIGTQSSVPLRGKGKVDSDPKPPMSKKVETKISDGGGGGESSSMDSKEKANSGPAAIGKDKVGSSVPSDSVSQPPKSEKAKTNISGESSSMDSKNKTNTESAAIVTQRSTRQQRGKGITTAGGASSPSATAAVAARRRNEIPKSPIAQKPIISPNTRSSSTKISSTTSYGGNTRVSGPAKKRLSMEPSSSSGRLDKGKAKMVPSEENTPEDMKDKKYPSLFKPVSITSSEANAILAKRLPLKKRAVVIPTSSVLTRQGKARLVNSQPEKSTASTARQSKPKSDSDPIPPADPQPPKGRASTSGQN
ncbi:suppressor protein SRP40-like [Solanum lycopersicum]|uniref:suppressor protein SRP40-like n=1 Tax=Solanum lycopersicum TaxID=4081 RepID=UPI003749D776